MAFNSRRVVEALLVPVAFSPIVSGAFSGSEREKLMTLLTMAVGEPIIDLNHNDKGILIRWTRKVIKKIFLFPKGSQGLSVPVGGIYLYYFLTNMLLQKAYYIKEDSNYMKFLDAALPAMTDWIYNSTVRTEAYECAKLALERLQKEEHMFEDVVWVLPENYGVA